MVKFNYCSRCNNLLLIPDCSCGTFQCWMVDYDDGEILTPIRTVTADSFRSAAEIYTQRYEVMNDGDTLDIMVKDFNGKIWKVTVEAEVQEIVITANAWEQIEEEISA